MKVLNESNFGAVSGMGDIERWKLMLRRNDAGVTWLADLGDADVPPERDGEVVEVVDARHLKGAVRGYERVGLLAQWIHRDRHEPDKVLAYAQELANLSAAHEGGSDVAP